MEIVFCVFLACHHLLFVIVALEIFLHQAFVKS